MTSTLTPAETLPAFLIGQRVRFRIGGEHEVGTILETGHRYGPGGGHDQASVEFTTDHRADPMNPHPCRRPARTETTASWYYLTDLAFA